MGFRDYFMDMSYAPGSNSCGNGAGFGLGDGFGSSFGGDAYSGEMSYQGMTAQYDEKMGPKCSVCGLSSADNHYHCPGIKYGGEPCNQWYASEIGVDHDKRTKKCTCGFTFNC